MLSLSWQGFWAQGCPSALLSHPSLSQFLLGVFSHLLLVWFGISLGKEGERSGFVWCEPLLSVLVL